MSEHDLHEQPQDPLPPPRYALIAHLRERIQADPHAFANEALLRYLARILADRFDAGTL
jgi:hypothetical protein